MQSTMRTRPVAIRVQLDAVHTCPECGAPRRIVSESGPLLPRQRTTWRVTRIECAGDCCSWRDRPCPSEQAEA